MTCLTLPGVAADPVGVSTDGDAQGDLVAVSANGNAHADGCMDDATLPARVCGAGYAVSGDGEATACDSSTPLRLDTDLPYGWIEVTGAGEFRCLAVDENPAAVALNDDAEGDIVAVSGTGNATTTGCYTSPGLSGQGLVTYNVPASTVCGVGVAVSGTGEATTCTSSDEYQELLLNLAGWPVVVGPGGELRCLVVAPCPGVCDDLVDVQTEGDAEADLVAVSGDGDAHANGCVAADQMPFQPQVCGVGFALSRNGEATTCAQTDPLRYDAQIPVLPWLEFFPGGEARCVNREI